MASIDKENKQCERKLNMDLQPNLYSKNLVKDIDIAKDFDIKNINNEEEFPEELVLNEEPNEDIVHQDLL